MEGEGGTEQSIFHVSPRSEAFLDYATGPRARALLSVSPEWWSAPGSLRLRYEDLVHNPLGQFKRLTHSLEPVPRNRLSETIAANTLDQLRTSNAGPHFWQGKPGLWRSLLTASEARRIEAAHREVFQTLGYQCDPDETLDAARADAHWAELCAEDAGSP
jgi:hypothetical protein